MLVESVVTWEAQAQVISSAAVMLVSRPNIGTPVSSATHLGFRDFNFGLPVRFSPEGELESGGKDNTKQMNGLLLRTL